jgi:16S rRNA processing protein RimM
VAAEAIRGNDVMAVERRELGENEYWPEDLVGLDARDPDGKGLGKVSALVTGGAQDRLVIEGEGTRFEVPFVTELVPDVDLAGGFVVVNPIEGLIEP